LRVIIVHGSYGSADGNWFPWLASRIQELGHESVVPQFPTPAGQSLSNWLRVFDEQVGALSPDTVLIGHSLGVAFVLRLLERAVEPIAAAYLVAGFLGSLGLPDFDGINKEFAVPAVDWLQVTRAARSFFVYGSDDDPYVPLSRVEAIAAALGVPVTLIKQGGHLNKESGFSTFPGLLADLTVLFSEEPPTDFSGPI
jgi:predicted alpha/beta hydrolase family esterase